MNHGLMEGMFWAGVLLSVPPLLLFIGIGWYVIQQQRRDEREMAAGAAAEE